MAKRQKHAQTIYIQYVCPVTTTLLCVAQDDITHHNNAVATENGVMSPPKASPYTNTSLFPSWVRGLPSFKYTSVPTTQSRFWRELAETSEKSWGLSLAKAHSHASPSQLLSATQTSNRDWSGSGPKPDQTKPSPVPAPKGTFKAAFKKSISTTRHSPFSCGPEWSREALTFFTSPDTVKTTEKGISASETKTKQKHPPPPFP